MQGNSILLISPSFNSHSSKTKFEETADKVVEEFSELNLDEFGLDSEVISSTHGSPVNHHHHHDHHDYTDEDEEEEEEDDDDFEFSCACDDHEVITLTADEIFSNGQIRPIYPIFNRDLEDDSFVSSNTSSPTRFPIDKFFNDERLSTTSSNSTAPAQTYCILKPRTDLLASPEIGKKSTSTGTSKRWRLRDLIHRSNSDSKETLVFLARSNTCSKSKKMREEAAKNKKQVPKVPKVPKEIKYSNEKTKTVEKSAHEKHYVKNREMKEGQRRRSYLPYKTQLFGFVASVNGLSKNLNPF
ncbi:hypothetical protein GIB67_004324 [Kingdonia uniflora]|uniref:Uncharacterized protein n=1 Tax=Kingdonia uniflora TaxID=39325 RepID=A0A7J7MR80_9MAGN|nr:hypothetical protein GIB67_004324 [Kingdonia uniflora]